MTDHAMCLLHGDYHAMNTDCWRTTLDWFFDHQALDDTDARDVYQTAVERQMLNQLLESR